MKKNPCLKNWNGVSLHLTKRTLAVHYQDKKGFFYSQLHIKLIRLMSESEIAMSIMSTSLCEP